MVNGRRFPHRGSHKKTRHVDSPRRARAEQPAAAVDVGALAGACGVLPERPAESGAEPIGTFGGSSRLVESVRLVS